MTRSVRPETRAVLFDLDGVLVDTMPFHFRSWKALAATLAVDLSPVELEAFRGIQRELCLDHILTRSKPVDAETYQRLLDEKNELFRAALSEHGGDFVLPGARTLLGALRARKIAVGLVSASKNVAAILKHARLTGAFDAISDGNFHGPPKPSPRQITHVADLLGVEPQATAVFEDAASGLDAAKAAGALAIGIGPSVRDHVCDHWFGDLAAAVSGPPLAGLLRPARLAAFDLAMPDGDR